MSEIKESPKKKCVIKTIECKQFYNDYKSICPTIQQSRENKCETKDFEKMTIDELDIYIDHLLQKYNTYKSCYDQRVNYTVKCITKKCWDSGTCSCYN